MPMTIGRQQPYNPADRQKTITSASFLVTCDLGDALFSELGGISSEIEQAEYMEAGIKGPSFGRFLGKAKPPTVSLKRSMTRMGGSPAEDSTAWIWTWHTEARSALMEQCYKDCTLKLFAAGSDDPARIYFLSNAIPTKVEIGGMKAGGTEVVIQTLTLMCDAIEEG